MTMLVVEFGEIGQRMTAQPDRLSFSSGGSSHAVHFYENDDELSDRVATFIGEGLLARTPAVIVASAPHRQQFTSRLAAMKIDGDAERGAAQQNQPHTA